MSHNEFLDALSLIKSLLGLNVLLMPHWIQDTFQKVFKCMISGWPFSLLSKLHSPHLPNPLPGSYHTHTPPFRACCSFTGFPLKKTWVSSLLGSVFHEWLWNGLGAPFMCYFVVTNVASMVIVLDWEIYKSTSLTSYLLLKNRASSKSCCLVNGCLINNVEWKSESYHKTFIDYVSHMIWKLHAFAKNN